jgi:hypothetical protein
MTNRRIARTNLAAPVAIVAALLAGPALAAKGFVITEETRVAAGKPAKRITYLTDSAQRTENGSRVTVLALKGAQLKLFDIDDKARSVKDSSALAPMLLMSHIVFLDQDASGQARVRPGFATPTAETRTIGKWTTRKVVIKAMDLTSSNWYTKESPDMIGAERMRTRFFTQANEVLLKPQLTNAKAIRELADINKLVVDFSEKMLKSHGAPVMSETDIGDGIATTRVVSVESRDLPDKLFAPPPGYRSGSPLAKAR